MSLKLISFSVKVFLLTAVVGLVILYFLPVDEFGKRCGSDGLVPFGIGLLMVLLPLTAVIVERLKKKISNKFFVGFLLLLILLALVIWIILNQGCVRCAYSWQRIRSDMNQLQTAQEIFYKENNRYANTQEELIDAGIFTEKFKNAVTDKDFTDGDGKGIEGGDNNPKTWSAITYISYKRFNKWCRLISEGYWYICNQDDCYEESELPEEGNEMSKEESSREIEDGTADWQTYRNKEYGFEIKYPKDWTALEDENPGSPYLIFVTFGSKKTIQQGGFFAATVRNQSEEEYLSALQKEFVVDSGTKTILGDRPATIYSFYRSGNQELKWKTVVTPLDNLLIEFSKGATPNYNEAFNQMLSTFRFFEEETVPSSSDDDLLHKLFPNLEFKSGQAVSLEDSRYGGIGLSLFLDKKIEDYFISKKEKSLLFVVSLTGVPHAGGLYHSYLGLFDLNGNLLTPTSVFPEPNTDNLYGNDYYDFHIDKAQFGADGGEFGFYNCNGIKYILFVFHGCPNGTCCFGGADLFKINNGEFEKIQTINEDSLTQGNFNSQLVVFPSAYAAKDPSYGLKIILSEEKIIIKKVPSTSDTNCPETDYKQLKWNKNSCRFE